MEINILFFILSFIVIFVIIYLSDSYATAVLTITVFVQFLVISTHFAKMHKKFLQITPMSEDNSETESQSEDEETYPTDGLSYNPDFNDYQAYKTSYSTAYVNDPLKTQCNSGDLEYLLNEHSTSSVDNANVNMSCRRSRDKKVSDGWALKDSNYYKYHFSDELDKTESREWWSKYDY